MTQDEIEVQAVQAVQSDMREAVQAVQSDMRELDNLLESSEGILDENVEPALSLDPWRVGG